MCNTHTTDSDWQFMVWAMPPDEFGAWGQWAGAMGALLAVVVALWVAISDVRRRARDREDQRAAQARTVVSTVKVISNDPGLSVEDSPERLIRAVVHNYSSSPVLNLSIFTVSGYVIFDHRTFWQFGESDTPEPCAVLGPDASHHFFVSFPKDVAVSDVYELTAMIRFTDVEGITWNREGASEPERVLRRHPRSKR